MPNTVLQYRLPHSLPGIGGGDQCNSGGVGGYSIRLFGMIPGAMPGAIARDPGSYAGVSQSPQAIAMDTRYLSDILLSPPRVIIKFY